MKKRNRPRSIPTGRVRIESKGIRIADIGYISYGTRNATLNKMIKGLETSNYTITYCPEITEKFEKKHCKEFEDIEQIFSTRPKE